MTRSLQEEIKSEQRRRNLLVLILHYLQEEGYACIHGIVSSQFMQSPLRFLDTAHAFSREAGPSLTKFDVCDNIDLPTILQVSTHRGVS